MPAKQDEFQDLICHICSTKYYMKKEQLRKNKNPNIRKCSICNKLCCVSNPEVSTPRYPVVGCFLIDNCLMCNKKDVCENCRFSNIACSEKCELER